MTLLFFDPEETITRRYSSQSSLYTDEAVGMLLSDHWFHFLRWVCVCSSSVQTVSVFWQSHNPSYPE
ncbi:unnamed protein product [Brassica oleracea var. botrytis]|uniref:(rape) hypothetical protein n=1 Tax=Brassica napus TaxID=3708 RepID=A0A816J889_BRANA|nr:unnamed protein product [Brassica napus]